MHSDTPPSVVALLFGGQSGEHTVSVRSAGTVFNALAERYHVVPVYVSEDGQIGAALPDPPDTMGSAGWDDHWPESLRNLKGLTLLQKAEIVFPVLHGPMGEDGTVQGLLETLNIPYVGSGVTGSALAMDKALTKAVLKEAGIPVVDGILVDRGKYAREPERYHADIQATLGLNCFVKPCNMGSSVGISHVRSRDAFSAAMTLAFRYDRRVLVEKAIPARELEVAVLGNDHPEATLPGEVVPGADFYDYDDKYTNHTAKLLIPAPVDNDVAVRCQQLAVDAFLRLDLHGMARVDFFLDGRDGQLFLNEINTIPGFTDISMYPKLWAHQGISTAELVHRLVQLALESRRRYQWREPWSGVLR